MAKKTLDGTEQQEQKLYDEKKVAARLGIRRRFVCRWRETMGERARHWTHVEGLVALTEQGVRAMTAAMGLTFTEGMYAGAEIEKNGRVTVTVYYKPPNRNKLLVRRLDNKKFPDHVEVKDSSLFRVGDTFEAAENGPGGGMVYYGRWPEAGW